MKEKTKKWLTIAGLAVIGLALAAGITMRLYREEAVPVEASTVEQETEVITETEDPVPVPASEEELVTETEEKTDIEETGQQIQPLPEKTETDKPEEPPALQEGADVEDPDAEPAYEEGTEESGDAGADDQQNPTHGDTKDGMIYVDGFGWIPDEGGGGSGTVADDMFENGNTIGIME